MIDSKTKSYFQNMIIVLFMMAHNMGLVLAWYVLILWGDKVSMTHWLSHKEEGKYYFSSKKKTQMLTLDACLRWCSYIGLKITSFYHTILVISVLYSRMLITSILKYLSLQNIIHVGYRRRSLISAPGYFSDIHIRHPQITHLGHWQLLKASFAHI